MQSTYIKLILAAIIWGGTWPVGRILAQEAPVFTSAFFRFGLAFICLFFITKIQHKDILAPQKKFNLQQNIQLFSLGMIGVFAYNYCFLSGLKSLPASEASLIIPINPVIIACASALLGEKKLPLKNWLGVLIACIGGFVVISKGDFNQLASHGISKGHWLIFGCVICWTVYTLLARRITQYTSSATANLYACGVGAAMLAVTMWHEKPLTTIPAFSYQTWACIIYLSLLGTVLSYTWFTDGVKKIGSTKAAAFVHLVPVFGVLFSAMFLHETLYISMLLGGCIILLGVYLTQAPNQKSPKN